MKPTIFFSHSSLDSESIKPVKDYLLDKTGNAIQIFMSSDGASIPFGKNWLKEIEEALSSCKLMFVWVTPNSSNSNWIYFESGCAYSRGIKVVPVGFDGVKLENLPAPLNFLQGFNIYSASSLNNIIAIINQEFGLTFPHFFDENFYQKSIRISSTENSPELLKYVSKIKCVFDKKIINNNEESIVLNTTWYGIFRELLNKKQESYTAERGKIYGVGYKVYGRGDGDKSYPEIYIDPLSINNILPILLEFSEKVYDNKNNNLIFIASLQNPYHLPDDHFQISSRLINTEVDLNTDLPNVLYKFRNIMFRINIVKDHFKATQIKELVMVINKNNVDQIPLLSLMRLLEKQMVIHKR